MLSPSLVRFVAPLATVTVLLAACGGAAAPSATAAPTAAATTSAPPSASATTSTTTVTTGTWTVSSTSKATVRVREQLVGVNLPSDAVLVATAHRSGNELTATTTASPTWKFADFGMTAPSVPFRVVSVVDEIRLVVDIVATVKA